MSTVKQNVSSGSEGDPQYAQIDERKKRRMISNRESARRSRMRKQQHLDDLVNQVNKLQKENDEILQRVNSNTQVYLQVASENNVLRAQYLELKDRLDSLNSVIRECQPFCMETLDIPEIPDPLLKPWSLPCQSVPITAAADMFPF
uniref:BZIP domain-containing protein n=1 Tax=Nelumbo nucifera TaxID=4432 RepID=A0A822YZV4_NELNU|nr:TPA_asm: hypothetical protein HUJ06_008893 [Nelumbo nucifera]